MAFLTSFLPRDASAERGDATVSRLSVRLSVTIRYRVQIRWNSSKIISRPNAHVLVDAQHGRSGATGTPPKLGLNRGGVSVVD